MNMNSRGAIGSIFAAVQTLMLTLIGLLKSADRGVSMLDVALEDAQENQLARSAVDRVGYETRYAAQAALATATEQDAVEQFRAKSKEHEANYDAAYASFTAAIAARKARARGQTPLQQATAQQAQQTQQEK